MINRHLPSLSSTVATLFTLMLFLASVPVAFAEPEQLTLGSCSAENTPDFEADTEWLKLPPGQVLGPITAVAVDDADHLWVLHRPTSVADDNSGHVLAPVVEFDSNGDFLRALGGPSDKYEWPDREHSLAISAEGHLWIGGSSSHDTEPGRGDDMLVVLDSDGRFILQIGRRGESKGNLDRQNLRAPADIYIDDAAAEVYVADGYGNQRVIVFDKADGSFLRMWNAFGSSEFPESPAELETMLETTVDGSPSTFNGVHGVEMANDGLLYVSDRLNQRIQVFTSEGEFLAQAFVNQGYPSPLTASGITFSPDKDQKYMYVTDWGNNTIEVFERLSLTHIGQLGEPGSEPGQFLGPHLIDTDSQGIIYVAEVQGARVQRLIPCNTEDERD